MDYRNSDQRILSDGHASSSSFEECLAFACRAISDTTYPLPRLAIELARMRPKAPALELVIVLSLAANSIQDIFMNTGASGIRAAKLWQQAAMVGVDAYYLGFIGVPNETAEDLLRFWERQDA